MIEALEDKRRKWRHAYHTRYYDIRESYERGRSQGLNNYSDRKIDRLSRDQAEREVNLAINRYNESVSRPKAPRNVPEPTDQTIELPPIKSKRDFYDSAIIQDVDEI